MVLHILKRTDSTKYVARGPGYLSGTLSAAYRMMSDREPDNQWNSNTIKVKPHSSESVYNFNDLDQAFINEQKASQKDS